MEITMTIQDATDALVAARTREALAVAQITREQKAMERAQAAYQTARNERTAAQNALDAAIKARVAQVVPT